MKQTLAMISIIAALIFGSIGALLAADFDAGLAALQKGDYAAALREWTPLAERGDAVAQFNLALMYDNGQGVRQDYQKALKWYALAAEQGDAEAQFNLGVMYYRGQGVRQDDKTALKWFRLAAEQGHAEAQLVLGAMYYGGYGVSQDYITAPMWANIAAENGSEMAPELRNAIAKEMPPAQIHAAQKRAKDCVAKNYKDC